MMVKLLCAATAIPAVVRTQQPMSTYIAECEPLWIYFLGQLWVMHDSVYWIMR